jgi:hypothetical protein
MSTSWQTGLSKSRLFNLCYVYWRQFPNCLCRLKSALIKHSTWKLFDILSTDEGKMNFPKPKKICNKKTWKICLLFFCCNYLSAYPSGREAYVCGRSPAEIVGSNPAGAWMSVCCECCVLLGRVSSLRRADHSSGGVLPTVVLRCVWSRNLVNDAMAHWRLSRQKTNKQSV